MCEKKRSKYFHPVPVEGDCECFMKLRRNFVRIAQKPLSRLRNKKKNTFSTLKFRDLLCCLCFFFPFVPFRFLWANLRREFGNFENSPHVMPMYTKSCIPFTSRRTLELVLKFNNNIAILWWNEGWSELFKELQRIFGKDKNWCLRILVE